MKYCEGLSAVLAGTAIATAIVITLPSSAMALTGEEISDISREITVLIVDTKTEGVHGSGFIISKNGKNYSVLTAHHVVDVESEYRLVTADKKSHKIDYQTIKVLSGVDLAVVQFTADENYSVAKLANSDLAKEGGQVFVSGWPAPAAQVRERIRLFVPGAITSRLDTPIAQGYSMVYSSITRGGMSGGPVLDAAGRVIGIHGLGDSENPDKLGKQLAKIGVPQESAGQILSLFRLPGYNLGIPINTFLTGAPQAGVYLSLQVENTPATQLSAAYVPSEKPDKRDTIDNINNTLNTIDRVRGLGCRFGICF
ncbi:MULTISPECIES: serine protease [unclassified Microcoleus]|uniref:serine protease n=1 Tax=unclassified Microcoleus TaxID=2642155 RepID=UPI002FD53383